MLRAGHRLQQGPHLQEQEPPYVTQWLPARGSRLLQALRHRQQEATTAGLHRHLLRQARVHLLHTVAEPPLLQEVHQATTGASAQEAVQATAGAVRQATAEAARATLQALQVLQAGVREATAAVAAIAEAAAADHAAVAAAEAQEDKYDSSI